MIDARIWWLWPLRWVRALGWALRGVCVAPSALLAGCGSAYAIGRGTRIGCRTRLIPGHKGKIILGQNVWLSSDIEMETGGTVEIGEGTSVQRRCSILGNVTIGRGCIFSPNVYLSSGTHPFRYKPQISIREQEALLAKDLEASKSLDRPVSIGDDCWLGVNVFVSPGVKIGKGAIVGANAVVTHDVEPYTVVAGIPARVISKRQ